MTERDRVDAELRLAGWPDSVDLNQVLWALVPLADRNDVTVEEVEARVEDGSVLAWLEERHGVPRPSVDEALFVDYLQRAVGTEQYGVNRNGLLLLVAECAEALQQRLGKYGEVLR